MQKKIAFLFLVSCYSLLATPAIIQQSVESIQGWYTGKNQEEILLDKLMTAIDNDNLCTVQELLKHGAPVNNTSKNNPLNYAINRCKYAIANTLLEVTTINTLHIFSTIDSIASPEADSKCHLQFFTLLLTKYKAQTQHDTTLPKLSWFMNGPKDSPWLLTKMITCCPKEYFETTIQYLQHEQWYIPLAILKVAFESDTAIGSFLVEFITNNNLYTKDNHYFSGLFDLALKYKCVNTLKIAINNGGMCKSEHIRQAAAYDDFEMLYLLLDQTIILEAWDLHILISQHKAQAIKILIAHNKIAVDNEHLRWARRTAPELYPFLEEHYHEKNNSSLAGTIFNMWHNVHEALLEKLYLSNKQD